VKIEVDEIMTDLPQTAREQAIAIIREARKVYENHAGDGAWIAMEQAYAKLIESALSRSSDGPRTPAIQLQARRADGGDWVDIFPAQLQWMAKEDHEVRAVERCSDETARESVGYQVPVGMKLVYVKRWRTIVPLPATHADEIVEALRPTSDGGVSEALALRLRDAAQTAQNDDLSRPISEKRDRHVIRVEAMLDAAEYLEEISAAASPHSRPHGGCE